MSNFNNKSITNKGLELLSAAMAGGKLEFTRIVMGSGTYSGDIGVIESLVNQKQSLDIKSITKKGSQVILSTTLLQSVITEDFYWKEIGVYAKGDDEVEVLYMYGSATDTSFISKDMLNEKMINVGVLVSNAQKVSATIDGSLVYLSRADLEAHNTSNSAHSDIRELIKQLQGEIENIDVSWDGITDKPSTFPPSEHNHDDRYYTESEIDSKLNDKANTSHAHTKSQITDFPTSLPANGGNANTLKNRDLCAEVDGLKAILSKSTIKSIQRGLAPSGRDIVVNISPVDLNKAIVIGNVSISMGASSNYNTTAYFINNSQIKFLGQSQYQQPWQVIEFN